MSDRNKTLGVVEVLEGKAILTISGQSEDCEHAKCGDDTTKNVIIIAEILHERQM